MPGAGIGDEVQGRHEAERHHQYPEAAAAEIAAFVRWTPLT
jgi:hypothetical protein